MDSTNHPTEVAQSRIDWWSAVIGLMGVLLIMLVVSRTLLEMPTRDLESAALASARSLQHIRSVPEVIDDQAATKSLADFGIEEPDPTWQPISLAPRDVSTVGKDVSQSPPQAHPQSTDQSDERLRQKLERGNRLGLMCGVCVDRNDRAIVDVEITLYRMTEAPLLGAGREVFRTARSDEDGFYELGPRPADYFQVGRYEKERLKEGYAKGVGTMIPAHAVFGCVTRPDGRPLAGASVGSAGAWPNQKTQTDEHGNFHLRNVPDRGKNTSSHLSVSHSEYGSLGLSLPPQGGRMDVQFAVPGILQGRVVGPGVRPIANATVHASHDDHGQSAKSQTDAEGLFEIRFQLGGTYTLFVGHNEYLAPPLGKQWSPKRWPYGFATNETGISVVLGEVRHAPIIRMRRPSYINGQLICAESGLPLKLRPDENISVSASNEGYSAGATPPFVPVQSDGTFRIAVTPGLRNLYLSGFRSESPLMQFPSTLDVKVAIEEEVDVTFAVKQERP